MSVSQTRSRPRKLASPTVGERQEGFVTTSDFDPNRAGRDLLRPRSSTIDRWPGDRSNERPGRTPARPCGFSPFGRFRVLFDSLFRVLFDFPSRYLFAVGLAIGVEPRMERTTRLRAAFSNDPTLEPTRRFDLDARARSTGPTPSQGRNRSRRLGRARLSAYFDCRRSIRHMSTNRSRDRPDSALGSRCFHMIVSRFTRRY